MVERAEVFFDSGGVECAAYLYGSAGVNGNVPCVVKGHGFSGTRDLGLHVYAERFAAAGMAVLVFDYRHFGASGGKDLGPPLPSSPYSCTDMTAFSLNGTISVP
jgi:fermentation-respiration switch protein FrsA (DUF1100 family)